MKSFVALNSFHSGSCSRNNLQRGDALIASSHPSFKSSRTESLWILLLDVDFSAPLLGLSCIVLLLGLELGLTVACDPSDGAAHGTSKAVCCAGGQVAQLALGLLSLTAGILFLALTFEILIVCVSCVLPKLR